MVCNEQEKYVISLLPMPVIEEVKILFPLLLSGMLNE